MRPVGGMGWMETISKAHSQSYQGALRGLKRFDQPYDSAPWPLMSQSAAQEIFSTIFLDAPWPHELRMFYHTEIEMMDLKGKHPYEITSLKEFAMVAKYDGSCRKAHWPHVQEQSKNPTLESRSKRPIQ